MSNKAKPHKEVERKAVPLQRPISPVYVQGGQEIHRKELEQLRYGLNCVVAHLDSKYSPGIFTDEERELMGFPRAV